MVIYSYPTPDFYLVNSIRTFQEETIPICLHLFQEIEADGMLPNSFFEVSNSQYQDKDKKPGDHYDINTNKHIINTEAHIDVACRIPNTVGIYSVLMERMRNVPPANCGLFLGLRPQE